MSATGSSQRQGLPSCYETAAGERYRIEYSTHPGVETDSTLFRVDAYAEDGSWVDGLQVLYGGAGRPRVDLEAFATLWPVLQARLDRRRPASTSAHGG